MVLNVLRNSDVVLLVVDARMPVLRKVLGGRSLRF